MLNLITSYKQRAKFLYPLSSSGLRGAIHAFPTTQQSYSHNSTTSQIHNITGHTVSPGPDPGGHRGHLTPFESYQEGCSGIKY